MSDEKNQTLTVALAVHRVRSQAARLRERAQNLRKEADAFDLIAGFLDDEISTLDQAWGGPND